MNLQLCSGTHGGQTAHGGDPRKSTGSWVGEEWAEELISLEGKASAGGRVGAGVGLDHVPHTLGC